MAGKGIGMVVFVIDAVTGGVVEPSGFGVDLRTSTLEFV